MTFSFIDLFINRTYERTEVDKVFEYMGSLTRQQDSAEYYLNQFKKLKRKEHKQGQKIYIKLYLSWEEYLINDGASLNEKTTKELFRKNVSSNVNIENLDPRFKLIFMQERERLLLIYELAIEQLVIYVIKNLGFEPFVRIMSEISTNTVFADIKYSHKGISFEKLNQLIINSSNQYSISRITRLFKVFITTFYNKIELSLGEQITRSIFQKLYNEFHTNYNAEFATHLLKITPEKILSVDEWLSLLSKSELERQVKEQTHQLEELNNSLEEKVKERTQELQEAYDDIKELDEKKSEFISVATHQIRTPVSGIKWILSMLQKGEAGELKPEQLELIKKAQTANDRLSFIINDILDTDLIAGGKIQYNFSSINISKIIRKTIRELYPQAQEKNIEILLNSPEVDCCHAYADDNKIQLVIENLLDNAIKYSPKGSKISVKVNIINDSVNVEISDSGIGIPEEFQKNIFERFYRAPNGIRTHANGSGLGLFIAKNIVEAHKGTIEFKSSENKGTTFIINLPLENSGS